MKLKLTVQKRCNEQPAAPINFNKTLIDKFQLVVDDLEKEYGELTLFGLFLREESFEKWDVIVSAKWLNPDSQESYSLINTEIQKFIKNGNLIKLSRIVILSIDQH